MVTTAIDRRAQRGQEVLAQLLGADQLFFAEAVLGHDLWSEQRQVLDELAQPNARVAIKACHASSKTYTAAESTLWAPYAGGIAITTATTGRQVKMLAWKQITLTHPPAD